VTDPGKPPRTKAERERAADRALARSTAAFVVRRPLDRAGLGVAAGAGLVAGLVTAYLTAIWVARTPLDPLRPPPTRPPRPRRAG
jgi:hypothetical protein